MDVRITPCSFLNFHRGTVLHLIKFKRKVRQALLRPNGQYIAVADSWKRCKSAVCTAPWREEVMPLVLHRTFTGQSVDVTCIAWSVDTSVVMAGVETRRVRYGLCLDSKLSSTCDSCWRPQTSLVGAYFSHCNPNDKITSCCTIIQDGALVRYTVPSIL
jgi:hypothetical protein